MKILVTGGAGFIGSALIRYIIQHTDDEIVNVDKLTYAANLDSVASVSQSPRYAFEQLDICHQQQLERVFAHHQPDAVMHLAAESHVDRSISGSAAFIQTNIVGTYTLLEVARHYWQGLDSQRKAAFRFHHISTDEVFGDLPHPDEIVGAQAVQFCENSAYAPSSPYSASKASSDHLVQAWHRTYGLPIIMSNCSNNYGPYQYPEKLIPFMLNQALKGKPLTIYGKGHQIRDWLYVDDHARALYCVISRGRIGERYNIGGQCEMRNIEVVQALCEVLEQLQPCHPCARSQNNPQGFQSLITYVADRPGHDLRYAMNISKIEKELGWKPLENFETGMHKTICWYLNYWQ